MTTLCDGASEQNTLSIKLSIIMPSYNDAQVVDLFLPQLYDMLKDHFQTEKTEILLVDDGSKDDLYAVYERHCLLIDKNIDLRLIKLSRNFGKEAALSAGLAQSNGELVALMDSDGQHPTTVLVEMLELYESNTIDMIAAVQTSRDHENKLTKWLKERFYHFMQDTQRYDIVPNAGDFRLMSRKVVEALLKLPERQRFMKGLYSWVGFKTLYIPFEADQRFVGDSKFKLASLFELALTAITSFSLKPLRLISRMGILVSIISILYGLYIVGETIFFGQRLAGWPTLAAGIMFSAGLQMICFGVIGEYIGRIYEEVKQRPLYIVDEQWHSKKNHPPEQ